MMEPYSYRRLGPREIRVLVLRPGQADEPLQCQIRRKTFNPPANIPEFEALSYAWGEQLNAERISVINNKRARSLGSISIGQNLATALHHLRLKDKPRTLWCDSICINQSDPAERAEQLLLMGDIYKHASPVLIWLGPEADDSSLALQTLSHLGTQVKVDFENAIIYPTANYIMKPPFSLQELEAISALISRKWYERLWVWQEIALASSHALIICGAVQVKWRDVAHGFSFFWAMVEYLANWDKNARANAQRLWSLVQLREKRHKLSLHKLISYTIGCDCSEPHDRIYALLGLLHETHKLAVKPDYTQSPKDLYRSVVALHVENYDNLDMLEFCEVDESPSWVPDIGQLKYRPTRFSAAMASSTASAYFKITGNKLEVRGILCGSVPSSPAYEPVASDALNVKQVVRELSSDFLGQTPDDWDIQSARALCETLLGFKFAATGCGAFTFDKALQVIKQWGIGYDTGAISYPPEAEENILLKRTGHVFQGRSCRKIDGSAFLLSSHCCQPGDLIYTILGCSVPLILRTNGESQYSVVGPCWHSGYMSGEALLGELPAGWSCEVRSGSLPTFTNGNSNTSQRLDPRLSGIELPHGWHEDGIKDGETWWYNSEKNVRTWRDPRVEMEALQDRGVHFETLTLI
ncbi:heterokaryon incompatibility protein-domain-containing protein [Hypoxylon sp. FL0543]|nr:heterokaryon incompatibility protein-domain-containing protein [Hypoxylon sp. FL0543]